MAADEVSDAARRKIIPDFACTHKLRTKLCGQKFGITPPKQKNLEEIFLGGPSGRFCFAKFGIIHERAMLKKFQIQDGKLVENGTHECPVHLLINPDDPERKYLIEQLGIDEYNINSALDPNELGRLEFEPTHTVLIVKRPKRYSSADNFLLKISSVGLFMFKDKIVILLSEDANLFEGRQFSRIRSIQDMLLKIIYSCTLHFENHLQVIHSISDELEQEINKSMANRHLINMFNLEKSLVYYLKAIGSNGRVIEKVKTSSAKFDFTADDNEFLEDVIIENSQCYEQASTYSQVLSNMMDAWVSLVSNNLNIVLKTLTLVMICIMLPTLVVNIFSMNVKLPIDQDSSVVPFWLIMGLAFLSVVLVRFIWRYKKW